MWGTDGGPYMQALHFFFGIGTILGPLLSEPYLSPKNETQPHPQIGQIYGYLFKSNTNNNTDFESKLYIPYSISAATAVISALIFLILFLTIRYKSDESQETDGRRGDNSEETEQLVANSEENLRIKFRCFDCTTIWLIAISGLFLIVYAGQETVYFQFSASFATQTDLHISKTTAAFMASALAMSFTITRALSILIAIKISPQYMIYIDSLVIFTAQIVILVYANTNENYLWFGNILMGAGFASVFPSFYPFIERYLKITNIVSSMFIFCTGLSSCICPLIVGLFIETKPFMLIYLCLSSTILTIVALILLQITTKLSNRFLINTNNEQNETQN
ncbi:sodium-dependent glucose transporter 1-like [Oppia nitens]|uniref:sodium-dependent glucose transporter 1-like n=1 Tax=Oppia nitens TaxID=1686743 RepID=UPI0023DB4EE3|nr:sodium-dependent glucose transporter 1-like [Oppia nitens]